MIPDQIPEWNKKHSNGDHENLRYDPSPLSTIAEPWFPRHAEVLELGCGVGRDSVYFAEHGHRVIATDGAEAVIAQDKLHFSNRGVTFSVLDMRQELPYAAQDFDVVYANLSLHYYEDEQTRQIVTNISRILRLGGRFAFACKSDDSRAEGAREMEGNIILYPNGRALHLFTIDYTRDLLADLFEVNYLDEVEEEYNGDKSKIVRCIATRTAQS